MLDPGEPIVEGIARSAWYAVLIERPEARVGQLCHRALFDPSVRRVAAVAASRPGRIVGVA